ncbi:MAG: Uma2 family endonuclease [Chloroflexi bacterium]|nr:Uma2 family endonuclease [Chloroflexota bacterium]
MKFKPLTHMDDDMIAEFSALNDGLRIERTAKGEIVLMPPTHGDTGSKNARINTRLGIWSEHNDIGDYYDSSTGFKLPNGALRSPDASWVLKSRLDALTQEERSGYISLCPDFVVELRSTSDSISALQAKMQEYMDNGARLGWLIDTLSTPPRVHVYRPGTEVEILDEPTEISGAPELPGFVLNMTRIWEASLK